MNTSKHLLCVSAVLAVSGQVRAQEDERKFYFSTQFQHVTQKQFRASNGDVVADLGELVARTLQFDLSYRPNERWSFHAGIPLVSKRYTGPLGFLHDPLVLDNPRPDVTFYDNGEWQTNFSDIELGVQYHTQYRDWLISPFVRVEFPSHNYDVFGLAAPGDGLRKLGLGVEIGTPIGLTNFYVRGEYSYVIAETAPGDVNVNHHRFQAELGYFLNPKWTLRVFTLGRVGNGLDFPEDYPSFTDDIWFYHDQTMSHEFVNAGIGAEYQMSDRYNISMWTQDMLTGRNSNTTDSAFYLQVGYSF